MNDMNAIFTILLLGCGGYCLYQAIYLLRKGELPPHCIILPKDRTLKECLDPEGYLAYMKPRFLIFSIIITVCALFSLVNDLTGFLAAVTASMPAIVQLLAVELFIFLLPFSAVVWFSVCMVKIQKQLW